MTSNLTLCPENMFNKDKGILIKVAERLSDKADVVDKESYYIAKKFANKIPLGVVMISSDVLSIKKHMMNSRHFNPNQDHLANVFINSIREMLK